MTLTLKEIAELVGGSIEGDFSKSIQGIGTLDSANSSQISYAVNEKYKDSLKNSNAGAFIINKSLKQFCQRNIVLVENVYLAYSILSHKFKVTQNIEHFQYGHKLSYPDSKVSASSLIGKNVKIGKGSIIGVNCVIEDNVSIGSNSTIEPNVSIQRGSQIGRNCVISPGAVIGSEGFGNARDADKKWSPIAHLGNVLIGNNVSIGANTTIDRGTISDTEIHDGVKIDNLIHIAHNVIIGEDTAIAAKTGTAQVFSLKGQEYDEENLPERLKDHALFIAYAPAEQPKIALAVIVENGGHGGSTAGPIAKQVFDYYIKLNNF